MTKKTAWGFVAVFVLSTNGFAAPSNAKRVLRSQLNSVASQIKLLARSQNPEKAGDLAPICEILGEINGATNAITNGMSEGLYPAEDLGGQAAQDAILNDIADIAAGSDSLNDDCFHNDLTPEIMKSDLQLYLPRWTADVQSAQGKLQK